MRPGEEVAPQKSAQDLADDHEMRLLRAKQKCRQVLYLGLLNFVGELCSRKNGTTDVYLTGKNEAVRPDELSFPEIPT